MFLGPVDEVGGNEEVGSKTERINNTQFVVETFLQDGVVVYAFLTVAHDKTFLADLAEVFFPGGTVRSGELRIFIRGGGIQFDRNVAAFGDTESVVAGFGIILEEFPHFFRGFEIDFRRIAHASGIREHFTHADADMNIMCFVVVPCQEVCVVGSDDRKVVLPCEFDELREDLFFLGNTVILKFDEEIVLAENTGKASRHFTGLLVVVQ